MFIVKYLDKKWMFFSSVLTLIYSLSSIMFLFQIKAYASLVEDNLMLDVLLRQLAISVWWLISACVSMFLKLKINDYLINEFQRSIRSDMFQNIQEASLASIEKINYGQLSTSLIQDVSACSGVLFGSVANALASLLYWIIIFGLLAIENFAIFLLVLFVAILLSCFIWLFRISAKKFYSEYARSREQLNCSISESIRCKILVRVYGIFDRVGNCLHNASVRVKRDWLKCNVTTPIVFSSIEIAILISYLSLFLVPRNSDAFFSISTSELILFVTYIPQLWSRYSSLSSLLTSMAAVGEYSKRIEKYFFNRNQITNIKKIEVEDVPAIVEAKHLMFGYDEQRVINDLNFSVRGPGIVYLRGASGTGKSTLFQLFCGIHDNYEGSLQVGGYEIKDLSIEAVEKNIGIVHQQSYILKETAYKNIVLDREQITKKEVLECARYYDLLEVLGDLDARVFTFSQTRVISILRVLIRNPAIFLFDEVTASLDSYTETKIWNMLKRLSSEKLCFVIEHKEEAIASDNNIVLE